MRLANKIAQGLQLPIRHIQGMARKASYVYKEYTIRKRTGGHRTIHHPSKELKAIQRWLIQHIIERWPVHDAAYAYRKGISIRENAEVHKNSNYLLRMDLASFFPSIDWDDLMNFLQSEPSGTEGWIESDRELFAKLVCRKGKLTIGAPTSPAISNSICYELDARLDGIATGEGVRYTRYADDLFFSTRRQNILPDIPAQVRELLDSMECPSGLRINADKTRHSSKRGRRQVTGLVLTSDERVSVGRDRKRFIRSQIYKYDELSPEERRRLAGHIAFAASIEPDFVNALILKYGREQVQRAREMST